MENKFHLESSIKNIFKKHKSLGKKAVYKDTRKIIKNAVSSKSFNDCVRPSFFN